MDDIKPGDIIGMEVAGQQRNFRFAQGVVVSKETLTALTTLVSAGLAEPGMGADVPSVPETTQPVGATWNMAELPFVEQFQVGGFFKLQPNAVAGKFTLAGAEVNNGARLLSLKWYCRVDLNNAIVTAKPGQAWSRSPAAWSSTRPGRCLPILPRRWWSTNEQIDLKMLIAGVDYQLHETVDMAIGYAGHSGGKPGGLNRIFVAKNELTAVDAVYRPNLTKLGPGLKGDPVAENFLKVIDGKPHKVFTLSLKKGDRLTIELKSTRSIALWSWKTCKKPSSPITTMILKQKRSIPS